MNRVASLGTGKAEGIMAEISAAAAMEADLAPEPSTGLSVVGEEGELEAPPSEGGGDLEGAGDVSAALDEGMEGAGLGFSASAADDELAAAAAFNPDESEAEA